MPVTEAGLAVAVYGGLASAGLTGSSLITLADGVAKGLAPWVRVITVVTADAGTAGSGNGLLPWIVPSPLLIANLLAGYASVGHVGVIAPIEATGLGNGLSAGFLQGLITTFHPNVGTGVGVARVIWPPAFSFLISGFSGVGIIGSQAAQKAQAISQALSATLLVFTLPIPIVGSATPTGTTGVGTGRII